AQVRTLIRSLVEEYADAQHAHRVLTDDVRFLEEPDRERILAKERAVVDGFAAAIAALRPDIGGTVLGKPLTMLVFGMINWMFTWMKPDGPLDYDAMAPIVADLFLGGLPAVTAPVTETTTRPQSCKATSPAAGSVAKPASRCAARSTAPPWRLPTPASTTA